MVPEAKGRLSLTDVTVVQHAPAAMSHPICHYRFHNSPRCPELDQSLDGCSAFLFSPLNPMLLPFWFYTFLQDWKQEGSSIGRLRMLGKFFLLLMFSLLSSLPPSLPPSLAWF